MCLSNVSKKFKPNDNMRVGYKLFNRAIQNVDVYYSPVYKTGIPRFLGKVYSAIMSGIIVCEDDYRSYDIGFHMWSTLKGAQRDSPGAHDRIVKVIAWDIRAYGQNRTNSNDERKMACFVAKNIRLMEEIEEKEELCA